VLSAVLVLSIGFLGMGALLAHSLSTNNSAMARSMATIASFSIMDAMRADYANASSGSYNTGTPIKASSCPDASGSLANYQLNQWCQQLGNNLGKVDSTTGAINCTANGNNVNCTVTIVFDDSRAGTGGSSTQTVLTQGML
jgi:type IV pilus assembly protein PilV